MCRHNLLFAAVIFTLAAAAHANVEKPIRIVLVGDSTVASYSKPPADKPDLTGWGQVFGEYFNDRVTVLNHAQSGRSTKSFIHEGLWQKALADKGDYIFIQFGHNDSHVKDGKPAVDPATDFQSYLRQYIDEARAAGSKPILVTPVARRTFKNGKIVTGLQPYADAMLKVGKEKGVPVIDLHAASMALFDRLGDQGSAGPDSLGRRPYAFFPQGGPSHSPPGRKWRSHRRSRVDTLPEEPGTDRRGCRLEDQHAHRDLLGRSAPDRCRRPADG